MEPQLMPGQIKEPVFREKAKDGGNSTPGKHRFLHISLSHNLYTLSPTLWLAGFLVGLLDGWLDCSTTGGSTVCLAQRMRYSVVVVQSDKS